MAMQDHTREKTIAAALSVVSNSILIVIKLIVGILAGSVSVMSEAIHSGMDLLASFAALFSVRKSGAPPDEEHPYGHGKWENVSGFFEAILIVGAAIWIITEAVHRLLEPSPVEMLGWGMAVMLVSALANSLIGWYLLKVGKKSDSVALKADAWHLLTDVYTSLGVMGGLLAIWAGSKLFPGLYLEWLDPVVAIAVALLIMKAGWRLTVESLRDLIDSRISPEEEQWIKDYIGKLRPVVRGFHGLRTRKAGASRFVNVHVIVDEGMSVAESHRISEQMEKEIADHLPGTYVVIHIEPCDGTCEPVCMSGCLLSESERAAVLHGAVK